MKVFLAGSETRPWIMKLFLAGISKSLETDMKIFLAESGGIWEAYFGNKEFAHAYILQSFYYANDFTEKYVIPNAKEFMLDSGAFTFMQNNTDHIDWDEYIERYADFINRNKVTLFYELDIDSVIGYDKVKSYRKKLEKLTGKQCIPVWHNNRGKDGFVQMCEEYPYVALGGLVGGKSEYSSKYWRYFPWFIDIAHKHGSKIHALGFTSLQGIQRYHFDSVDSTAWTAGNRFGFVYKFNGETMIKHEAPKGKRLADSRKVALINYTEWIKFQKYAETHL